MSDNYWYVVFGKQNSAGVSVKKVEKALDRVHDIRKFEIDFYWRRSTYFWGFQVVIFAGLAALLSAEKENIFFLLMLAYAGLLTAWAWFFVNKGSKYWKENWEKHIDSLEGHKEIAKLHKVTFGNNEVYSVSKINLTVSKAFIAVWFFVLAYILLKFFNLLFSPCSYPDATLLIGGLGIVVPLIAILFMYRCAKSDLSNKIVVNNNE